MNKKSQNLLREGVDMLSVTVPRKTVTANAGATSIMTLFKVPLGVTMLVEVVLFASGGATERAAYKITAAIKNLGGTTALVGAAVVDSFEDDAAYAATIVANNTKDSADLQVTPDTANDTTFWGYATAVRA